QPPVGDAQLTGAGHGGGEHAGGELRAVRPRDPDAVRPPHPAAGDAAELAQPHLAPPPPAARVGGGGPPPRGPQPRPPAPAAPGRAAAAARGKGTAPGGAPIRKGAVAAAGPARGNGAAPGSMRSPPAPPSRPSSSARTSRP